MAESLEERVWAALKQRDWSKSYEVAQECGIPGERVVQILQAGLGSWVVMDSGQGVAGKIRTWSTTSPVPPSQLERAG